MAQTPQRILIDTNILIHLEDNKEIGEKYSELNRLCSQYGISIYVHESSYQDILRDKDENRRKISLSKLEKYPRIHRTPRKKDQKEALFGPIKKENDEVDTDILVSLSIGAADLLVTEDIELKARVKDNALDEKVKNVDSTLTFFKKFFGAVLVDYKHVQDRFCNQYHHDHPFFNSLKEDYKEFEGWYERCMADQRPCWVIEQEGGIAGLIIYKDEDRNESKNEKELNELGVPGQKILKLSLFKVDPTIRGEKFGEQLLKKAMDYAYRNGYDATYLTVFPKHDELINLLTKFGFQQCGNKGGESVYFKYTKVTDAGNALPPFEFHKIFWPCTKIKGVDKFCVPIRPEFHQRLFPESAEQFNKQLTFLLEDPLPQTPGNAIRKVYICNSQTAEMNTGSLLLFYRSGDSKITSVGVLEDYRPAKDFEEIKQLAGNRSVYSDSELQELTLKKTDAKVMNFYYAENFSQPISLKTLKAAGVLKDTPQSITKIPNEKFDTFLKNLLSEKDRGIFYD